MLSIDEAIAHAREVAKRNREQWKNCPADIRDIEHQTCEQCAEEHEQLAEWLEELKSYRQYIDLTEIPEQYKLGFQDGIIAGNNKAIDDFADKIISLCDDGEFMNRFNEFTATTILELSEQLKRGGENGN